MKKAFGILIIFLFFGINGFSQPDDAKIETIDGKKYYVHVVEAGNTLYGIHQIYNTSVEKILNSNSGLGDDLTIGHKILIPIEVSNDKFYGTHVVAQGETLYGISRKYKCTVDELKKINDGIADGISPGQKIKIPRGQEEVIEVVQDDPVQPEIQYKISYKDSIIYHTVMNSETMYSISKRYMVNSDTIISLNSLKNNKVRKGDVLKIPVKKVKYTIIDKDIKNLMQEDSTHGITDIIERKEVYSVALMLPFMLAKNDAEMSKMLKIDQVRELYPTTKIAFEFYQGFKFALDSLTNAGLKVKLYVYDTKKDTNVISKIFKKKEFDDMDLVVGPLYNRSIMYAAKVCQSNGIKIVLPFKADSKVLHENPYVYKTVCSNMTLMDGVVDYILEKHSHHNILVFKPTLSKDKALYERVRERFNDKIAEKPEAYNTKIIEITLGSKSGREINALIRKDTANIVIIPSADVKFVSGAMMRLNSVLNLNPYAKKLRLIAFGLEDWNQYDGVDVLHRIRLNQHYASYRFVDYNQGPGLQFVKAYRNRYGLDPTVYSSQGFDIGMYFLGAMHLYGKNFDNNLRDYKIDLIQNDFKFNAIAKNSGNENSRVCIVMYKDYKLYKLK